MFEPIKESFMSTSMRKAMLPLAAALAISAAPAMAADYFVPERAPRVAVMPAGR